MGKHIPSLKIGQVNDTPQSAGAILDVISTSQGSLPIPRMTNAQMLVLGNLVQGLLVDQTDSVSGYPSGVYRYSGSAWVGFGNLSGSGTTNTFPIFTGSGTIGNSAFTYEPSAGRYNLWGKVGTADATSKMEVYSVAVQTLVGFYRNTSTLDGYLLVGANNFDITHNTGRLYLSAFGGNSALELFTSTMQYRTTLYHQFFCGGVQVGYFTSASLIMLKDIDIQGTSKLYSAGGIVAGGSSLNAKAILQADSTDKGFLPPRMTLAQRSAITSMPVGLIVYQTDGTEGLYVYRNSGWTLLASAANNIRQVDVQLFNYVLQQDVSYADAGTITTFINLNNQLSSATYQKFTYSAGVWSGGGVTNITFTAGVSTVSIAMAQYDFIRVVGVLAGANTQATLSIKTIIS